MLDYDNFSNTFWKEQKVSLFEFENYCEVMNRI